MKELTKVKLQRMNRLRAVAAGALAVSGALTLSGCGSDDNSTASGGDSSPSAGAVACEGDGDLIASGSSAQKNAMDLWVKNYTEVCDHTSVNYKATGSGAGVQEFLQGKTAFAGTDSALSAAEIGASEKVCHGGRAVSLPMVGGPIAIAFNLPGVDELTLDAKTLAGIFDTQITSWDDQAIKDLNPDADLPHLKIQAFHRSDESGTTDNFTQYLKAAAPSAWPHPPGKAWRGAGGQSADGSSGVSAQVKQVSGAISYVELSYATANGLPTARLDTGADDPVPATVDSASAAIAEAKVVGAGSDLALKLAYDTKATGAYPLTLVTYEVACTKGNKPATRDATRSFLSYAASEPGQAALRQLGYAPLPTEIAGKVRSTVSGLS